MSERKYFNKIYKKSVVDSVDDLTLHKISGSDWSTITMRTNGSIDSITIRSRDQLEQLGLMISQCLRDD